MQPIMRDREIEYRTVTGNHRGVGSMLSKSLLDGCDSTKFRFVHRDEIEPGVSIGVHNHPSSEEIYFLMAGRGILTYDGVEYEMLPGDISLCNIGHSHGFVATEPCSLLIIE